MVGVLVQENLIDHDFLAAHARGLEAVLEAFAGVDVPRYAASPYVARRPTRRSSAKPSISGFAHRDTVAMKMSAGSEHFGSSVPFVPG